MSATLLRMVQLGVAAEAEQRQVRRTAAGPPVAAAPATAAGAAADGSDATGTAIDGGTQLVLRRSDPHAPVRASVGAPGTSDDGTALDYWRPAWNGLPPLLADQLAASVLTRLAVIHQVTAIHAVDPASVALAIAIADGMAADTRYGEQP
ncbi:hypothetical protein O7632_05120 [Solwaraspora sp. WMMD406]|uniref:hypothetical protein n=1 Tax=Solwaraspora sp. WMMD406 TaxID=3016095 RepID=UPI00241750AB|nr:hypothetical protein [Solwaraspora sp. WMMD406]MDG4763492.1 hypothetical protein [Solwaraspora sp. WMMD406]